MKLQNGWEQLDNEIWNHEESKAQIRLITNDHREGLFKAVYFAGSGKKEMKQLSKNFQTKFNATQDALYYIKTGKTKSI